LSTKPFILKVAPSNVNGVKGISMNAYDWEHAFGGKSAEGELSEHEAYQQVAWVRRCVELRANALSSIPFHVYRGKTEVENWPYLTAMPALLWVTEASLQLYGAAYWERLRNRFAIDKGFKWLLPATMTPKYSATKGLVSFERRLAGRGDVIPLELTDVVYFWQRALDRELGPGTGWVTTILTEAGLAYNADAFAEGFFSRGAIPAFVLSVTGNTTPAELDRLEDWWKRRLNGVKRAWNSIAVRSEVNVERVGFSTSELAMPELVGLSRQQIATAAGVPQSLLEDAANYATAVEHHRAFYTSTLIPEAQLITAALNEQVFGPQGMECDLDWQSLDIFQEDEAQRAEALARMTQAGVPLPLAMEMLGFDLPGNMTYDDLRALLKEETANATPEALRPFAGQGVTLPETVPVLPDTAPPVTRAVSEDLDRWRRKSLSSLKAGSVADVPFVSEVIPDSAAAVLHERLSVAIDADDVRGAFTPPFCCVAHDHGDAKAEPYLVIEGEPLPPLDDVTITEDDIKRAFARWNAIMPSDVTDLLDAGVEA
jgi:HK97 family phage portal protein